MALNNDVTQSGCIYIYIYIYNFTTKVLTLENVLFSVVWLQENRTHLEKVVMGNWKLDLASYHMPPRIMLSVYFHWKQSVWNTHFKIATSA
jgi:hypothetical protein